MEGLIRFLVHLAIMTEIYAILSLTLNFQFGLTGLANFGHVAFFMLGAYVSTILMLVAHCPFGVAMAGAIIACGIFGLLIAIPTSRLKADYWAISTLAVAEILRKFFYNEKWIVGGGYYRGGAHGIGGIPAPLEHVFSPGAYPFFYLVFAGAFLAAIYLILERLTHSPFGRVLKTIREEEVLADILGKDSATFKMKAMGISGALAGAAGALYASYLRFIGPDQFMPLVTFIVWAMIVVGGLGNMRGALLGAVVIQAFYSSTRYFKDFIPISADRLASIRMVAIGVLIVLAILFVKEGLLKEKKRIYRSGPEEG
jgi:ABC-type branched-subunit amino acid transport system permease subunit